MTSQPHSSESASRLDASQPYDTPLPSPTLTSRGAPERAFTVTMDDSSPASTPPRSDFRFSALPTSSTTNLVALEKGVPRGESTDQPFRWNYPSLSELPLDPPEELQSDSLNEASLEEGGLMDIWGGWRVVVFCSWLNVLLLLIPVSLVINAIIGRHQGIIFTLCVLSMIPLVKLHDLGTRELALRVGGAKTGLLNASMSNTVELVIAITALRKCELRVVQSALIGSILSKLLLILGMCFFAGGLKFSEQGFDQTTTQIHSSLLSISVGVLLLPAVYHFALDDEIGKSSRVQQRKSILSMSHGVSIVLMIIYFAYLLFQFWSHTHLYQDVKQNSNRLSVRIPINSRFLSERRSMDHQRTSSESSFSRRSLTFISTMSSRLSTFQKPSPKNTPLQSASEVTLTSGIPSRTVDITERSASPNMTVRLVAEPSYDSDFINSNEAHGSSASRTNWKLSNRASTITCSTYQCSSPEPMSAIDPLPTANPNVSASSNESSKEPRLSWTMTMLLLILVTVTVAFIAEELVESMDGISGTISKQWVGLILLPAVSSIAECVTAMNVSVRDQLSLSISVAVNSTIQTTLFVIPLMVTLGWVMNRPLVLLFDPFESVVLYISVQTMCHVVADGKSNWLEGTILICLYVIIAVSFWYYPDHAAQQLVSCTAT